MFCPKCGAELSEGVLYCSDCGTSLVRKSTDVESNTQAVLSEIESPTVSAPAAAEPEDSKTDPYTPGSEGRERKASPKVIGIAVAVAVLALAGALFAMGAIELPASNPDQSTAAEEESAEGGSLEEGAAGEGAASMATHEVEAKSTVDEYSWEDLSAISQEIASAENEEAELEIAKKYGLCNANGTLDGSQVKVVELADGTKVQAQIVGFAHDDKTEGGKAGITFQFVDCVGEHEMNPLATDEAAYGAFVDTYGETVEKAKGDYPDGVSTNAGGWEGSSMRAWLNSDVLASLPADLVSVVVAVDKQTNNVGYTRDVSCVSITSDKLWLLSYQEIGGNLAIQDVAEGNEYVPYIFDTEGSQYKLFRDMHVNNTDRNAFLVRYHNGSSCRWWERSPTPHYSDSFRSVHPSGNPYYHDPASRAYGVFPGFCI